MNSETNWLDNLCECACCGDTYKMGYLISTGAGDDICEDCYDIAASPYLDLSDIHDLIKQAIKKELKARGYLRA